MATQEKQRATIKTTTDVESSRITFHFPTAGDVHADYGVWTATAPQATALGYLNTLRDSFALERKKPDGSYYSESEFEAAKVSALKDRMATLASGVWETTGAEREPGLVAATMAILLGVPEDAARAAWKTLSAEEQAALRSSKEYGEAELKVRRERVKAKPAVPAAADILARLKKS